MFTAQTYGNERGVGEGIKDYGDASFFPVFGGKL